MTAQSTRVDGSPFAGRQDGATTLDYARAVLDDSDDYYSETVSLACELILLKSEDAAERDRAQLWLEWAKTHPNSEICGA